MSRLALTVLLLATVAITSCSKTDKSGSKTGDGEPKSSTKALKDKVVGKWKSAIELSDEKIKAMLTSQGVPAAGLDTAFTSVSQCP